MFTILTLLLLGILAGVALRRTGRTLDTARSVSITVGALIFLFGISIGSNETLVNNLATLGIPALFIALSGIAGCILFALLYERICSKKGGRK